MPSAPERSGRWIAGDAILIEVWQAHAGGGCRHKTDGDLAPLDPNFAGTRRCLTLFESKREGN
ncbi:hypothetical protein [Xanthobacter autotrophicus]|uniref:hypothetical protein n=1 Tax=Xanthobacter autotrophicus TaxID=280 RepID=UPI003735A025